MGHLLPENYLDTLGTIAVVCGLGFSIASFFNCARNHGLKLLAIFMITAISLFADHVSCYFAALFIVATVLTELEFLQNLAAIIRGSKEYFDYQKEFMTQNEVEESIEQDIKQIEEKEETSVDGEDQTIRVDLKTDQIGIRQFAMIVEEYAFKYLERKYGTSIQRHIRYRSKEFRTEFDGIMERNAGDIIFEIKSSRRSIPTSFLMDQTARMIDRIRQYQAITKRKAELHMILVGPPNERRVSRAKETIKKIREKESEINIELEVLSFSEIGLAQFEAQITVD